MTIKDKSVEPKVEPTENEILRKELEDLRSMVKTMLENQTSKTSDKTTDVNDVYYDIEEELNINPNKMVKIVSMVIGGLNLRANNNTLYFPKFGDSAKVPFEELRTIVRNHDDLARSGAFVITDAIAVKGLYLEDEYEHILGVKKMEVIIDLPANEIVSVLKGASKIQRDTILQTIIRGIPSGDNRYTDYNKIKAISDYVGQDITELAKEVI
jgi:hypothetical protein